MCVPSLRRGHAMGYCLGCMNNGVTRIRTYNKKGCVERIAPRCTLSQNGYGTNATCSNGCTPQTLTTAATGGSRFVRAILAQGPCCLGCMNNCATRIRTYNKKGCVERIAPRCTLSQNGYGNNARCTNGCTAQTLATAETRGGVEMSFRGPQSFRP